MPAGSSVVLKVAVPFDRLAVPKVVLPATKVTEPVGVVPVPDCRPTVAVNVTDVPDAALVGDAVTAVVVAVEPAWVTVTGVVFVLAA